MSFLGNISDSCQSPGRGHTLRAVCLDLCSQIPDPQASGLQTKCSWLQMESWFQKKKKILVVGSVIIPLQGSGLLQTIVPRMK